ncbi:MAG TPA: M48 family metallopeptidase [Bacteroidia bacterium]|nr:M48 family metallopeptidase [Bacteroidia bacterium]MBP7714876.1 M48 family metallopeptidase [Bacteroidia bacterium]MBP8669487.1 M48 family metallopeptidase [Bacteroidia bacterium]HOZ83014.1 M48 family metallopeptidase [Bacteroidia bacterium]HQW18325.1 M48 family metallopeptidase [Bacteroidia bacterium]
MKGLIKILLLIFFVSCSNVPLTERKQINLLPESQMVAMALTSYSDFLKEHPPVVNSNADAQMVKRVGERVKDAVVQYMRDHNLYDRIKDYKWEFNLVDSKDVNAWCMPGGKVVVYSGLLPVTKNEESLALVMGHEIAHAIARHGNERMSQQLIAATGGLALDVALMNKPAETRQLFNTAYGVGANLGVLLPYSRLHETEADKLGLIFMAMAGYNPAIAPDFWKRMAAVSGNKVPEILSTHPSSETRIHDLNKFMPTAMKYYKPRP